MSICLDATSAHHQYRCPDRACFYCGRRVGFPHVTWNGHGSDLVLHLPCFIELTTRLFRDLHEMECAGTTLRTAVMTGILEGRGPGSHDCGGWPPVDA